MTWPTCPSHRRGPRSTRPTSSTCRGPRRRLHRRCLPGRSSRAATEVERPGAAALHRHRHLASPPSAPKEAKDFKSSSLWTRPRKPHRRTSARLSTTAKINVAHRPNALTIPSRRWCSAIPQSEKILAANDGKLPTAPTNSAAAPPCRSSPRASMCSRTLRQARAQFVPGTTVRGATDIECSPAQSGQEIVTGRYEFCAHSERRRVQNETTPPLSVNRWLIGGSS